MSGEGVGIAERGDMAVRAGKYLTFRLAEEEYGIGILKVQEIIVAMEITRVPRLPEFIRGVINLRGRVIPVIDLRRKFGLPDAERTPKACIVVVQVALSGREATMGVFVDQVSEVLDVPAGQLEAAPEFGAGVTTEFLLGIGKIGKRVVMLLDADRVLSGEELASLQTATAAA